MASIEKLLEMLLSDKASVRHEAREYLRSSKGRSPEIVTALDKTTQDGDEEVVKSAKLALPADAPHQMAIKMEGIEPDKTEDVKLPSSPVSPTPTPAHQLSSPAATWILCAGLALIAVFAIIEIVHQINRHAGWELPLQDPAVTQCNSGHDLIFSDSQGRIWVYPNAEHWFNAAGPRAAAILCRYDGNTWKVFSPPKSTLSHLLPTILGEDTQGSLWFGYGNDVLYIRNDIMHPFFCYKDFNYPSFDVIDFYAVDQSGRLWIVSQWCKEVKQCGPAITIYDGHSLTNYDYLNSSLPDKEDIADLRFDNQGRTWVSTSTGLSVFEKGLWKYYNPSDHMQSVYTGFPFIVIADSGKAWVYLDNEITLLEAGEWKDVPQIPDLDFPMVKLDQNGLPWVISHPSPYHIYHFNGEAWELRADDVEFIVFHGDNLFLDPQGKLWVGSKHGALIINETSNNWLNPDNSLVGWQVDDVAFDKQNRVWVMTEAGMVKSTVEFSKLYFPPQSFLSIRHYLVDGYRWLFPTFLIFLSLSIYINLSRGIQLSLGLGMIISLISHLILGGIGAFGGIFGAVIGKRTQGRHSSIVGAIVGMVVTGLCVLITFFYLLIRAGGL